MFQIGDYVISTGASYHEECPQYYPPAGTIGKIMRVGSDDLYVQWEAGTTSGNDLWWCLRSQTRKAPKSAFMVGDWVKFRSWKSMEKEFGLDANENIACDLPFVSAMKFLCGMVARVSHIRSNNFVLLSDNPVVKRFLDEQGFWVSKDMLVRYYKED